MFVRFKSLTFSNILSYGNKKTEIDFENGMNLISGFNGNGKSSFLDALSFCLYGQPYRKVKLKDLINRKNGKQLYTKIDFEINNSLYSIERTLQPNKLKVYKDNEILEVLSTKKMTQSEIDKIIGINYNLFRQIISLAINYNKPYLSLGAGEKRDIIESIFDIKIFTEMLKLIKKENTGLKHQTDINKKTLELLESNIKSLSKQIKDVTKAEKDFEKNKKRDKKDFEKRIKEHQKTLAVSEKKLNEHKKHCIVDTKRLSIHKEDRDRINKTLNKLEYSIKLANKNKTLFTENESCPLCKTELTKEHRESELIIIDTEIADSENKIKDFNLLLKSCKSKITKLEDVINKQNKSLTIVATEESKIDFLNSNIESLKLNIKKVDERLITFKLDDLKQTRDEKGIEYKEVLNDYRTHLDTTKTNDVVLNILSDNGIKSYFFKRLIPLLNKKIAKYLSQLDLPLQLSFNDNMVEEILNLGSSGHDIVSYFSLSEGEKKRVDMAILFSFIDITKTICNWNCNLIIMDELLDSSIDDNGLDKLMVNIKDMIYNNKLDMSIYIISHRLMESDLFKNIYEITKTNGFSNIKKLTN